MAKRIKIKKGLRIPLLGEPDERLLGTVTSEQVRICPEDYPGVTPRLTVKVGDTVKAGSPLSVSYTHLDVYKRQARKGQATV